MDFILISLNAAERPPKSHANQQWQSYQNKEKCQEIYSFLIGLKIEDFNAILIVIRIIKQLGQ